MIIAKICREVPFKERKEIAPGCTLHQEDCTIEEVKKFDSLEAAKKELENYQTKIRKEGSGGLAYYLVEEFFIIDDDAEYENILEVSKMSISIYDDSSNELANFDNVKDAYNFYENNENADKIQYDL